MKRFAFILMFAVLLAACKTQATPTAVAPPPTGAVIDAASPTAVSLVPTVALPTVTPEPSATPLPTETATPAATATPTPLPTPDPNLGVGDEVYVDNFDGQSGWLWGWTDEAATFGATGTQLNVTASGQSKAWSFVVNTTPDVGDQQVRVTARLTQCQPELEYGLMFRSKFDEADHIDTYLFRLNCAGQARFDRLQDVTATPLVNWTPATAIKPNAPAENTLMVWMAGDQFHLYVNDQYLFSAQDASLVSGFYGFYVRDASGAGGALNFINLAAKAVTKP